MKRDDLTAHKENQTPEVNKKQGQDFSFPSSNLSEPVAQSVFTMQFL